MDVDKYLEEYRAKRRRRANRAKAMKQALRRESEGFTRSGPWHAGLNFTSKDWCDG